MVEYAGTPARLDRIFAALADSTRRAILTRLTTGEATVTELAKPFNISLPAVSKHLKVLENAGLIARNRKAQWRPCRLEAEPLKDVAQWVADYADFWEERLDRLDEFLKDLQAHEAKLDRKKKRKEEKHGSKE